MNAEQLASEIANDLFETSAVRSMDKDKAIDIIAARLAPLVSDADGYHKLMEINDRMQKCLGYDD